MNLLKRYIQSVLVCSFLFCCQVSGAQAEDQGGGGEFIVATHYYGFKEYSWPINYLNAIKASDIESDMIKIKRMGFNTVILLVSWAEFEPTIGTPNKLAYQKIKKIIKSAKNNGLNVAIRIPYLWSLAPKGSEDMRERIIYALLDFRRYRKHLIDFMVNFEKEVILKNPNVVMKFGSWEDYYILRDVFFSGEPNVSSLVRNSFFNDTGVSPTEVVLNGKNYDVFNNWMDAKIASLSKAIGSYGYEIRTDSDLYVKDGQAIWHSHNKFYKNESNGKVVAYWAPYFGQKNEGEKISADAAIKSFSWMLDLISSETNNPPFIDQLNFFDNSPGTERNAEIQSHQLNNFFDKLTGVLVERTSGYALWTVRDYRHNIIYNPAFSEGLVGWKASKNVIFSKDGVFIPPGGNLLQHVAPSRFWLLKSKTPSLIVEIVSGKGVIDFGATSKISGRGRYVNKTTLGDVGAGLDIKIKADANSPDGLMVGWVGLQGHSQIGKVLDETGEQGEFYNLILGTNERAVKQASRPCRGYAEARSVPYTRGVFSDGWTGQNFEICVPEINKTTGFVLSYHNPMLEKRTLLISINNAIKNRVELKNGEGEIRICPNVKKKNSNINFSSSLPFIPGNLDKRSPDLRNLGVLLTGYEKINCYQKDGRGNE
jgi:hypothetical protein